MKIFEMFGDVVLKGGDKVASQVEDIGKKGKKSGKMLGKLKVGAIAAGGALAAGLGFALKQGIAGMIEMETHTAQLESVIKSTGGVAGITADEVIGMADAFEKTTKFSAESTLEGQNLLLTFTKIGKDVFPQATETMLNMATAMGTDASSQAVALGKALNDPVAGVASLTRVGVQFTDEQKKSIEAMMELGDIAGAQSIILGELETQFGGSAEAAGGTFAGQLEIAKNAAGDIFETMAADLMPILQTMLKWVLDRMPQIKAFMVGAFDAISSAFKFVATIVRDVLLPILTPLWKMFIECLLPAIQSLWSLIEAMFPIIVPIIKTALTIVTAIIGDVVDTVAGLINMFTALIEKIKEFSKQKSEVDKQESTRLARVSGSGFGGVGALLKETRGESTTNVTINNPVVTDKRFVDQIGKQLTNTLNSRGVVAQ